MFYVPHVPFNHYFFCNFVINLALATLHQADFLCKCKNNFFLSSLITETNVSFQSCDFFGKKFIRFSITGRLF